VRACTRACVRVRARAYLCVTVRVHMRIRAIARARAYVRAYVHMRRVTNVITITIHTNRLDLGRATELNIAFRCTSVLS
jgi:hypothetical protein